MLFSVFKSYIRSSTGACVFLIIKYVYTLYNKTVLPNLLKCDLNLLVPYLQQANVDVASNFQKIRCDSEATTIPAEYKVFQAIGML